MKPQELFRERVALYSPEQWRQILNAFVDYRFDDPLYRECRACFVDDDGRLLYVEADAGLLHGALFALGRRAYRRALLPFAEQMKAHAVAHNECGGARMYYNLKNFDAELRAFSAWCVGDDKSEKVCAFQVAMLLGCHPSYGDGVGVEGQTKGDPCSFVHWCCLRPLILFKDGGEGDEDDSAAIADRLARLMVSRDAVRRDGIFDA
jgi:hypothetical protein